MLAFCPMSALPLYVRSVWACSVIAQLLVLALLLLKGNFRKLPFFTTYVGLNLCQAALIYIALTYWHPGSDSSTYKIIGWASEAATLVVQALATTELLRLVLNPYRGIWGLAWRILAGISTVVVTFVVVDALKNIDWAIVVADRGYHLTFATAVIVWLLFIRYYAVVVPPAYKLLLGGFCFYSCMIILINTIIQAIWYRNNPYMEPVWQAATIMSFAIVQVAWAAALRKPLPVEAPRQNVDSPSLYFGVSPVINEQLRLLNERLMRLWKLEERPH
jgi:hypothetical protein